MRVLMVSDVYFPRVNGVSTSIATFRQALATQGVEVRLVVPRYGAEDEVAGILRVPGRRVPSDPEDRLVQWGAMHRAVAAAAAGCDLIHVQTPFVAHYAGLAAARRHRLPVLATYHTLFEEYLQYYARWVPAEWLKGLARRLSRQQCNALDAIVVPSTAMASRLASYGVTVPLQVLPTGIPLGRFAGGDGPAFRRTHGISPERPVALFVGRVAHEKNIGFLIEALATTRQQCPSVLLLITGEGPAMADLQRQAAALGLGDGVRFVGYLDRERELPDCYAAADAFVFASRTETQGLVLLEAMAAGLPVIGLAAMGTTDILAPGRGCFVPPDQPQGFGAMLAHFFNHPQAWGHLRREARAYAEEWSDDAMAARLATLYRQLAAARTVLPTSATVAGNGVG